jgi:class 3 adenylate cyclase/tetratricopeptide (TPR) repeat protein
VAEAETPGIATIVFTDMVGSTLLRSRLGEVQADRLRRIHDRLLAARIEANSGRVLRSEGDGLVAVFSAASEALKAAVEMQQAIASYNRRRDALAEISVRIGLSVGEVSWEDGDCFGMPMVEAARLEAAAEGAQILCSEYVRVMARGRGGHELRSIGFLELKGLPEPLAACEVIWEPEPDRAPLPLPSELAVEASRSFVSRTAELAVAESLLSHSSRNRLAVLWLLGEPGIGKTRLAAEIARRVHSAGGVVLFGRCNEDLSVPYQPFLEALHWYVPRVPDHELVDRLGDAPGELTRLVPEIGARLSGMEEPRSTSPEIEQHRLFEAVRTWLAAAGGGRPLVVVLDDIHWATRPTLALLGHVARSAEPSPTLLVCTARNTSPDDSEALAALVDELDRRGAPSHRLQLTGLGVEDVGELVEAAAGRPLDDRLRSLATELHQESAGNPLFVDALLAGLSTDPARRPGELHPTLAEMVRRRVARLPTEVAELLRTASVAGLDFDLRVAARAAGRDEPAALEALEAAGQAGLVDEDGANRYRFRHAIVRSALREQLSRSRRVRVHLKVGEALEAVHRAYLDEHVNALAYHFSEAIPVGAASRAYRYTILAAQRAARLLSHDEAVDAYGRALDLLDQVEGMGPLARYDLHLSRSVAQRRAGDVIGALDSLRAATEEAASQGAPEQLAQAAVAFEEATFWLGTPEDEALELLERAEEALPSEDSALRALTVASLSRALDTNGRSEGTERGHEAVAIAERLDDPFTSLGVLLRTTRSTLSVEQADASAARWMQLCRNAREIGDEDAYLLGLAQAMWATVMLGDLTTCDELFAEYSRLALQLRQPRWECWLDLFRALRAFLAADLEAAEQFLQSAEQISEGFGWAREGLYGVAMFLIRREQGRLVELAPAVQAAIRLNATPAWRPGLASFYTELGMLDEARQEFEAVVSSGFAGLAADGTRELCVGLLAEVCAALGDVRRAPWFLEQLRPCQGRLLVFLVSAAVLGPADRLLGILASAAGRPDDADRWHRSGLDLARRLDSPLWVAHCLCDYAVHLLPSDGSEARRMLAEAATICEEHGLAGLGHRVERLRVAG